MKVSRRFIEALKLGDQRSYKIAWQAGLNPSTLSKLICGIEKVKPNDPRVLAVGKILGLNPEGCFEMESTDETDTSIE